MTSRYLAELHDGSLVWQGALHTATRCWHPLAYPSCGDDSSAEVGIPCCVDLVHQVQPEVIAPHAHASSVA